MIENFDETGLENFKINIDKYSEIKLCEVIATFRYLGMMKDEALMSMVELARRRMLGDDFEYEKKIEEIFNTLPKFKLDNSMFKLDGIKGMI